MKMTPLQRVSALGKFCIALIVGAYGLVQIPAVKNALVPLAANHPHVASTMVLISTIGALLANPQVQHALGIEEKKESFEDADGNKAQVETKTITVDSNT